MSETSHIRMASFVSDQESVFAVLLALRSLQALEAKIEPPIVLISQTLLEEFESEYRDFKLKPIIKKLGGDLTVAFQKGYNGTLGFRPALLQITKRLAEGERLLYFSPRTVFFDLEFLSFCEEESWAARQPDDFWPNIDLYGPTMEDIWRYIIEWGGGQAEDWIAEDFPKEYWRRYPTASPHFFYTPQPAEFAEIYSGFNEALRNESPEILNGQGHIPSEAVITATIIAMGGKIIDLEWDRDLMYFPNFYNLLLRLNDEQAAWVDQNLLEFNFIRRVFKSMGEYKMIFYQGRVVRIREGFDEIERNFGVQRMEELIAKRKIRRQIKKRLKAMEAQSPA